jgi:hypothetical protein
MAQALDAGAREALDRRRDPDAELPLDWRVRAKYLPSRR